MKMGIYCVIQTKHGAEKYKKKLEGGFGVLKLVVMLVAGFLEWPRNRRFAVKKIIDKM